MRSEAKWIGPSSSIYQTYIRATSLYLWWCAGGRIYNLHLKISPTCYLSAPVKINLFFVWDFAGKKKLVYFTKSKTLFLRFHYTFTNKLLLNVFLINTALNAFICLQICEKKMAPRLVLFTCNMYLAVSYKNTTMELFLLMFLWKFTLSLSILTSVLKTLFTENKW